VAVRACETDPTLRRIVSSDYSASEFDALFFSRGLLRIIFQSRSQLQGVIVYKVDWLVACMLVYQSFTISRSWILLRILMRVRLDLRWPFLLLGMIRSYGTPHA